MKVKTIILTFLSGIIISMPAYAEFVFLKNGSIIEGKIESDSAASITIRDKEGKVKQVTRGTIMRVLYTSLKMGKIYIQKRDGEGIVAFMVDEDRDSYTFRKDLYKPEEFVLQRSDVLFIAEKNPSGLKGTSETDSISLTWLPPYDSVKHYNVYYSTGKNEKYKLASSTWSKSYTLGNLKSNQTYYIIVTSVDSDNYESSPSNELKINTKNMPPTPPENLKKEITSENKIKLSWNASTDSDGVVKEYRIFTREIHQNAKLAGKTDKTELKINLTDSKKIKQISVKSVDNNGDESPDSEFYSKPIVVSLKPLFAYPSGKMKNLFSYGYGTGLGISVFDYFTDDSIISIETGYIRWTGSTDTIDGMDMLPAVLSIGYRFYITDQISISTTAGAGAVFMSTKYTDAGFNKTAGNAFESVLTMALTADYCINENLSFSAGIGYYAIYEKSGIKNFAEAHVCAGYRLF